jgi:DNA invertase Pin-like site-specific DNA recombinase
LERNLIRERTRAGLKAARARGRNGGRPKAIDPKTFNMALEIYNSKKQRLAKCVNGWVLLNGHFTGIWNSTTSGNELTYRTIRGLRQKPKKGSWK